jgi:RNA polymerase sigma factor (TIGR02999 family)
MSLIESDYSAPLRPPANGGGRDDARQRLFTVLYGELHRLARRELRRSGPALTLSPTTLLHEVYLNLHKRQGVEFPDRAHFLSYASRAMRGLIIDYARSKQALKRGAAFEITSLHTEAQDQAADPQELQRLSEAIDQLAAIEPRLAQVVDLRYFGGFSFADIATMWGISKRTVQRDWDKARLFLSRALLDQDGA